MNDKSYELIIMEAAKDEAPVEDFVTVVSVGQSGSFVTVLSIGKENQGDIQGNEDSWDEEVEVYRLPGERLGFGLKFEGGNKTLERVKRLFVQSCAEQSPASRVKCSWGNLGEGDEILSIDGVLVIHMSRLDCVQKFKESQLIIKLMIRHQGAVKLQVVDEAKRLETDEIKLLQELSAAPPPVPPRKLKQTRGSADGHANPIPVKRQNGTTVNNECKGNNPQSANITNSKVTNNANFFQENASSLLKFQKEPSKAMACFDIISQNRFSTHECTLADKSLNSKNSTTQPENESLSHEVKDSLDQDFNTHPDYLLKHFALSEAITNGVTRDETLGENKNLSNSSLIEEPITLKPPINFQDSPLNYRHESKLVFYTPDFAADSTTHFRPIFDDSSLIESVDEDVPFSATEKSLANKTKYEGKIAPLLPAKENITQVPVDQVNRSVIKAIDTNSQFEIAIVSPLRKDSKLRRRRLPLPLPSSSPPPTPILPPPTKTTSKRGQGQNLEFLQLKKHQNEEINLADFLEISRNEINTSDNNNINTNNENNNKKKDEENCKKQIDGIFLNNDGSIDDSSVLIELEKIEKSPNIDQKIIQINRSEMFHKDKILPILLFQTIDSNAENFVTDDLGRKSKNVIVNVSSSLSSDNNKKEKRGTSVDVWNETSDSENDQDSLMQNQQTKEIVNKKFETLEDKTIVSGSNGRIIYQLQHDDNEEVATRFDSEEEEDDDNSNDYYWQSNLETIGEDDEEEEETSSLRYTSMKKEQQKKQDINSIQKTIAVNTWIVSKKKKSHTGTVNDSMEKCEGGQRLPPDGDEFPAAYQEFSVSSQPYQFINTYHHNGPSVVIDDPYLSNKKTILHASNQHVINHPSYIITNVKESAIKNTKNINQNDSCTTTFVKVYSPRDNKHNNKVEIKSFVLDEKIINIHNHDPRESRIETAGGIIHPVTDDTHIATSFEKDRFDSQLPPLPLTGPPRMKKPISLSKSLSADNATEKFVLNSRQDDKSEKSVKDKIAMFSSQSSLESPLFPNILVTNINTPIKSLFRHNSFGKFSNDDSHHQQQKQQYQNHPMQEMVKGRTLGSLDHTDSSTNCSCIETESTEKDIGFLPSLPLTLLPEKPLNLPSMYDKECNSPLTIEKFKPNISPQLLSSSLSQQQIKKFPINLIRATSFSGGISHNEELSATTSNGRVLRTTSFASTLERNDDNIKRTNLNQLIEQRKKGISKLRGLVIPEKVDIPVDRAIIDLPEIKSRDSILVQQKGFIQDKWGSQSSLTSDTSTQSMPMKTTLFKMSAPQIFSKYSPAFKRKSLTVCSNSNTSSNKPSILQTSPISQTVIEPLLSDLERICSPTKSDYNVELTSNYSSAGARLRPRLSQRMNRADYDDSDNDSAVSSSQSSISRGFSPPSSPVASERLNSSSESGRLSHLSKAILYPAERINSDLNRSNGSSSSSYSSLNSRSPPPLNDHNSQNSGNPQNQFLKRSSSTETHCSTSLILTSGSQTSYESLSRRILKPQSVEAINRKNILASARCRSGRDLSGSPLIQRKVIGDEKILDNSEKNTNCSQVCETNGIDEIDISNAKIAYANDIVDDPVEKKIETMKPDHFSLKGALSHEKTHALLNRSTTSQREKLPLKLKQTRILRMRSALSLGEVNSTSSMIRSLLIDTMNNNEREMITTNHDDLIMTLSTRSRSRTPINFKDIPISSSKSQMRVEDILIGINDSRATSLRSEGHLNHSISHRRLSKETGTRLESSFDDSIPLSVDDKLFVSKIPTYARTKIDINNDLTKDSNERSKILKIPSQQLFHRRSASVTDIKKSIEKSDFITEGNQQVQSVHTRFPSLDSSTDKIIQPVGSEVTEHDRFYGEQFRSNSSLASSTDVISQQELAHLVEEASFEESSHGVIVIILHKENPSGSVGITLAGGVDCEAKEITVHRVLSHSIADRDGRLQRGDQILSINGKSTRGLNHKESLAVLKQPRSEVVLVVSRGRMEEGARLRSRTQSVETIIEVGFDVEMAWGPAMKVNVLKHGAGLGFSLEGGRDSPLGDRPLLVKKLFAGGAAEKTKALTAGDQLLEVNGIDVTLMSRIEAWSLMKKLQNGEVSLLVRHPATKSS